MIKGNYFLISNNHIKLLELHAKNIFWKNLYCNLKNIFLFKIMQSLKNRYNKF